MSLAIRCIDGKIAHGDTFHDDRRPDLKADFLLANPAFNISVWGGERLAGDKRWQCGLPQSDGRVDSLSGHQTVGSLGSIATTGG